MKRLIILVLLLLPDFALAETAAKTNDLDALIAGIGTSDPAELSKMTFFELNFLKNAVFSAKGYAYAKDRQWLYDYFYQPGRKGKQTNCLFDLSGDVFPNPDTNKPFEIDTNMEAAIAKVQVALFRKLKDFRKAGEIYRKVDEEYQEHVTFYQKLYPHYRLTQTKVTITIFNRKLYYEKTQSDTGTPESRVYYPPVLTDLIDSIKREDAGYRRLLSLIERERDFDESELLGIYAGGVELLRNCIEARHGKPFDGPLGWQIEQLIGTHSVDSAYNRDELDWSVKHRLETLDRVIQKMNKSGIGDLPPNLLQKGMSVTAYTVGC